MLADNKVYSYPVASLSAHDSQSHQQSESKITERENESSEKSMTREGHYASEKDNEIWQNTQKSIQELEEKIHPHLRSEAERENAKKVSQKYLKGLQEFIYKRE